jgi:protein SCO1/2
VAGRFAGRATGGQAGSHETTGGHHETTMSSRARTILLAAAVAVVAALALALLLERRGAHAPTSATTSSPSGFDGAALPAGLPVHPFTLTDQSGRRTSLSDQRGRVVVLAFVYPTCGSTCVLIAQQIRGALDELPRPVPVLLVSADPAADTPARVRRFLAQVSLSGRARYLTGSTAELARVWGAYGVLGASAGKAAFDRSAPVLLLDRRGRERIIFGLEQLTPEGLAHDIRKLEAG